VAGLYYRHCHLLHHLMMHSRLVVHSPVRLQTRVPTSLSLTALPASIDTPMLLQRIHQLHRHPLAQHHSSNQVVLILLASLVDNLPSSIRPPLPRPLQLPPSQLDGVQLPVPDNALAVHHHCQRTDEHQVVIHSLHHLPVCDWMMRRMRRS